MSKKRDYYAGGLRIPRELKPPWVMSDHLIGLAFMLYFLIILGFSSLCITFGWFGSHW